LLDAVTQLLCAVVNMHAVEVLLPAQLRQSKKIKKHQAGHAA
jgi:hypothetical protein